MYEHAGKLRRTRYQERNRAGDTAPLFGKIPHLNKQKLRALSSWMGQEEESCMPQEQQQPVACAKQKKVIKMTSKQNPEYQTQYTRSSAPRT